MILYVRTIFRVLISDTKKVHSLVHSLLSASGPIIAKLGKHYPYETAAKCYKLLGNVFSIMKVSIYFDYEALNKYCDSYHNYVNELGVTFRRPIT